MVVSFMIAVPLPRRHPSWAASPLLRTPPPRSDTVLRAAPVPAPARGELRVVLDDLAADGHLRVSANSALGPPPGGIWGSCSTIARRMDPPACRRPRPGARRRPTPPPRRPRAPPDTGRFCGGGCAPPGADPGRGGAALGAKDPPPVCHTLCL